MPNRKNGTRTVIESELRVGAKPHLRSLAGASFQLCRNVLVHEQIVAPSATVHAILLTSDQQAKSPGNGRNLALVLQLVFLVLPKAGRMSGNDQLATCGRIEPFGRMRHHFVDVEFQPICVGCAHELAPERVAEAEEMDRRWEPDHNNKS